MKNSAKSEKGYTRFRALLIVIMIAMLSIAGVAKFTSSSEAIAQKECQSQQSKLNEAYKRWQSQHPNDEFVFVADISSETSKYYDVWFDAGFPVCPQGGTFSFVLDPDAPDGAIEYKAQCSILGHNH